MGAWGYEIFDNDAACDWQVQLFASDDLSLIEASLQSVVEAGDFIDTYEASEALAACETIAHLRGRPGLHEAPFDNLSAWVNGHKHLPVEPLVPLAKQALQRIVSDDCDLKQVWQETDYFDKWLATVEDVASRIE